MIGERSVALSVSLLNIDLPSYSHNIDINQIKRLSIFRLQQTRSPEENIDFKSVILLFL